MSASGPAAGGNTVIITGTNFAGVLNNVYFGTTPATSFTRLSLTQISVVAPPGTQGTTVDITVQTNNGTSPTSSADQYYYEYVPVISSLSSTVGPTAGGGTMTITGTHLTGATAVDFGTVAATSVDVVSDTEITCTIPAGTADESVEVTVTVPGGTSNGVSYEYLPVPSVTALSPAYGGTGGGTSVTLTGSGFTDATAVQFGGTAVGSFTVASDTEIITSAPAGSAGTVNVTVTTPGGTSPTSAGNVYTYVGVPTITGLSPNTGHTSGGTSVVLTGTNFIGVTSVEFGTTAVTTFTIVSDTEITTTSPAESVGSVYVTVTNSQGTSPTGSANQYVYSEAYDVVVAALSPTYWWPLGDASGASYATESVASNNGTPQGTITFGHTGSPSEITETNMQSSGGYLSTTSHISTPTVWSTVVWFKTTSTAYNPLMSINVDSVGGTNSSDIHTGLDSSGKIWASIWTGSAYVSVESANAYNDGNWHLCAATFDETGDGLSLYVDGLLVGNAAATAIESYSWYWRVGGANISDSATPGGPGATGTYGFTGSLSQAAVWQSTRLTGPQISNLWISGSSSSTYEIAVIETSGLVGYWPLSETSGTVAYDLSGNGNNGTYNGGYTQGETLAPSGFGTTGVHFNGSSGYVSVPDPFSGGAFTLEIWGQADAIPGAGYWMDLFSLGTTGGSGGVGMQISSASGGSTNGFTGVFPDVEGFASGYILTDTTNLHHYVFTYDGGTTARMYVDGTQTSDSPITVGTPHSYTSPGAIGYRFMSGYASYWEGVLAHAAAYNVVLTAAQVNAHYEAAIA